MEDLIGHLGRYSQSFLWPSELMSLSYTSDVPSQMWQLEDHSITVSKSCTEFFTKWLTSHPVLWKSVLLGDVGSIVTMKYFFSNRVCVCVYTVLAYGVFSYNLLHFKKPYVLNLLKMILSWSWELVKLLWVTVTMLDAVGSCLSESHHLWFFSLFKMSLKHFYSHTVSFTHGQCCCCWWWWCWNFYYFLPQISSFKSHF